MPEWKPLLDLHPCDLQASMLKKCTPANVDADAFYAHERRKHVRAVYVACAGPLRRGTGAPLVLFSAAPAAVTLQLSRRVLICNRAVQSRGRYYAMITEFDAMVGEYVAYADPC